MTIGSGVFGWLRVKVCIFPYTLKVVLTTLTLPCECDKKSYTGCRFPPNSMTLNAKIGVFMDFWRFRAPKHISIANCAETNWDRHGEAVYQIFSIERRFRRSKSWFFKFKETCPRGNQKAVPPKKSLFYCCWPVFHENGCRYTWSCYLSQQALVRSFSVVSTSMTFKAPELSK